MDDVALDDVVADFVAEAMEGLEALDSQLVRLEQCPDDPELLGEIFRLVHTLKGTSGFLGLGRLQRVAHAAENVLGGFRDGTLGVNARAVTTILDVVDVIRDIVGALAVDGREPAGDDRSLIAVLDDIFEGQATEAGSDAKVGAPPETRPMLERLGGEATLDAACEVALGRLARDPELSAILAASDPDRLQARLRDGLCALARGGAGTFADTLIDALPDLGDDGLDRFTVALTTALHGLDADPEATALVLAAPRRDPTPAVVDPTHKPSEASQSIRVSVDVLENLMTVVSELVLIRNQLIQTLRIDPESPFAGPLHRLNQVTSELQEGVMTTRMQPISGAWAKLPRLVRDLASDLGKRIDLVMQGQDTELDRQVLELIKDPLTHMIRNAADHGIETPERRRAAGKSETGRISLQARHEGGAIVVEMSDDGRGLAAGAIRAKALAAGVITSAQAAAMTDGEARQLIFTAGFSTADQVTAVSGRGVGMDVVRTNIEKIGGAIELSSTEGQGTRFTIRIPLTLSIVSALIVESCGERFAMPQASIVELVSATNAGGGGGRRIEEINGTSVLRLRDRLLPLVSLQSLLGLEDQDGQRGETCIVVARVGAFSFGVIVDRVFDTEEIVVKPVASVLRHLKLYSGATILGDGSVIMILDFKGMSMEAGAGHLVNGADEVMEASAPVEAVQTRTLLVFRDADDALKAAPLDCVARIEDLDCSTIEQVDRRSVIQYRGELMPIVGGDGRPVTPVDGRRRPLLVFQRGSASLGLLTEEIVDIVEGPVTAQLAASGGGKGAGGSLIVAGRATELIDQDVYWRSVEGGDEIGEAEKAVAAKAGAEKAIPASHRRILVVDESPFTRLLLGPLLAQAGYQVEVATRPGDALALHDGGEVFDLILADTTPGTPGAREMAQAFGRAAAWHATPLLGLGAYRLSEPGPVADLVSEVDRGRLLSDVDVNLMRGAA